VLVSSCVGALCVSCVSVFVGVPVLMCSLVWSCVGVFLCVLALRSCVAMFSLSCGVMLLLGSFDALR
jgi:hypothetical protein